jgi:hypothetical protein
MRYIHFTFFWIHMLWGIPSQWRFLFQAIWVNKSLSMMWRQRHFIFLSPGHLEISGYVLLMHQKWNWSNLRSKSWNPYPITFAIPSRFLGKHVFKILRNVSQFIVNIVILFAYNAFSSIDSVSSWPGASFQKRNQRSVLDTRKLRANWYWPMSCEKSLLQRRKTVLPGWERGWYFPLKGRKFPLTWHGPLC